MSRWSLDDLFDVAFLSHEVGHVKPDREIFEHAVRRIGTAPERILFLDDNLVNVERARTLGMAAEQVRAVDEAGTALRRRDVLP